MTRKVRLEFAGACYHVISRGKYRRDLFGDDGTAESFRNCLFEAAARFGWRLHAFVIMRNHFHLAVETPETNLSEGMRWLRGTWEEERLRDAKFGRLSRGWVIGSKAFKTDLKTSRGERFQLLGADRTAHGELHAEIREEKLAALAKGLGIRIETLPVKKSAPQRVMLAAAMKLRTSASNRWLAERLGMGEPATVSQYVRRFRPFRR